MSGEVFQWMGERARLGAWRSVDGVGYLAPFGDRGPASCPFARACTERLTALGFRAAVTSALLDTDTDGLVAAGFDRAFPLQLLRHDLDAVPRGTVVSRRARRVDLDQVVAVDEQCFDGLWVLDRAGLAETAAATGRSRFRVVDADLGDGRSSVVAYAVTGIAGTEGYLQRLAVHPAVGGRGIGRGLVADALTWLSRHGARHSYVNTQIGNDAALSLYRTTGFRTVPTGLRILSRSL